MITFNDVMLRVRTVLLRETATEKIRDRDIATALKLDPQYFAVIKRRNKIPYEPLALFCKTRRISINWILFGQQPQELT
jgi:hypothetical protein